MRDTLTMQVSVDKNGGVTVSRKKRGGVAGALGPQQDFTAAGQGYGKVIC